jgi:hypothetical protein
LSFLLYCGLTSHTDRMYGRCVTSIVAHMHETYVATLQIYSFYFVLVCIILEVINVWYIAGLMLELMFVLTNLLTCLVHVYMFIAEMKRLTCLAIVQHSVLRGINSARLYLNFSSILIEYGAILIPDNISWFSTNTFSAA